MDFTKYLTVLVVLCLEGGETGGHGEKHHDHVKLHVPEFIHHDHHTKVITIHHHHHKPKKEHHHHHHHHHKKPQIPHSHHYHHHHKKAHTTTHTTSKGHHTNHGNKGHGHQGHHNHHGHHGHQSHHDHHGHGHYGNGHHHETPSYNYDSSSIPSFEDDFGQTFTPSIPSYGGGLGHQTPQVHGITHTVKQVKVYDSLPGVLPSNTGSQGYEVTEQGEDTDDDVFTSVNSLQQTYPMTYGYVRSLAAESPSHDTFSELTPQHTLQNHEPFSTIAQPTASFAEADSFIRKGQDDPFSSALPAEYTGAPNIHTSAEFPVAFLDVGGEQAKAYTGVQGDVVSFAANDETYSGEVPVTFAREAGIQQTTKTGGVETIEY